MSQPHADPLIATWKRLAHAINDNVSGTEFQVRIANDISLTGTLDVDDDTLTELADLVEGWLRGIESNDQPFSEEGQQPMVFSRGGLTFALTAHKRTSAQARACTKQSSRTPIRRSRATTRQGSSAPSTAFSTDLPGSGRTWSYGSGSQTRSRT